MALPHVILQQVSGTCEALNSGKRSQEEDPQVYLSSPQRVLLPTLPSKGHPLVTVMLSTPAGASFPAPAVMCTQTAGTH